MKKNKGFTLIELLVVVSIIGLLSSVVLASLSTARTKAQNSAKLQEVKQYQNALELYRSDHDGSYPNYGYISGTPHATICLGYTSDTNCLGAFNYSGNDELNSKLSAYIPGPPPSTEPIPYNNYDFKGIVYGCTSESNAMCSSYQFQWFMNGQDNGCAGGRVEPALGDNTHCVYDSQ